MYHMSQHAKAQCAKAIHHNEQWPLAKRLELNQKSFQELSA